MLSFYMYELFFHTELSLKAINDYLPYAPHKNDIKYYLALLTLVNIIFVAQILSVLSVIIFHINLLDGHTTAVQ